MITYDETTSEIKVRLKKKHVGTITGSRSMGYWYKPKGGAPGQVFKTVDAVKRSLEDTDEPTLEWQRISPEGSDLEAITDFGVYTISMDSPLAGGASNLWRPGADVDDFETFGSFGEANERAIEDFYERVNSRNG